MLASPAQVATESPAQVLTEGPSDQHGVSSVASLEAFEHGEGGGGGGGGGGASGGGGGPSLAYASTQGDRWSVNEARSLHCMAVLDRLRVQREQGRFCDLALSIQGRTFAAHR